jgi:hypothetical protein
MTKCPTCNSEVTIEETSFGNLYSPVVKKLPTAVDIELRAKLFADARFVFQPEDPYELQIVREDFIAGANWAISKMAERMKGTK